jgi:hypothetical protein
MRPLCSPSRRRGKAYLDGDGNALGEALVPALGAGEVIDGLLVVVGATPRVPNQFHCVKPKKRRINTRSARTAAATPAPAPAPMSLPVSTTSEPAGLQ